MSDKPLIVSLLIGLIVVLVVAGVSLLVKMNSLSDVYKKELASSMSLQKNIQDLNEENSQLKKVIEDLKAEANIAKAENSSLPFDAVSLEGSALALPGLMSLMSLVPARVPSDVQTSLPWGPSSALKKSVSPTWAGE